MRLLYIGKGHILTSLKYHLAEESNNLQGAKGYLVEYTGNEKQTEKNHDLQLKNWEKKHGSLPKYNLLDTRAVS